MSSTLSVPAALFLLLTKDTGYAEAGSSRRAPLAAGAVTELILAGRIELEEAKNPRVRLLDDAPTGDPALDRVLAAIGQLPGRKLQSLVSHSSLDVTHVIGRQLCERGVLEEQKGIFSTRYSTQEPGPEQALRRQLAAVLQEEEPASPRAAAVLGILRAMDLAHRILREDVPGMGRRAMRDRIEEIARDVPTVDAVRASYQAMQTAMMTAVIVPMMMMGS
ncbi:GOLPH3/VPS74 family protein [Brachybacterium hainanense]|uniref:GPP34 family phosphoprotein n=1 Tax=Brachybacterium hainanense TaxID=1541174 RepID=A0ABV6R670_9MICO